MSTVCTLAPHGRILKGRLVDVSAPPDFCKVLGISLDWICLELIRYTLHNLPTERRVLEEPAILQQLPVELLIQLEIPVLAFQETNDYDIHRAPCTKTHQFGNQESQNDWLWVEAGSEEMYGPQRGHLPAKLIALFKILDCSQDSVRRLAGVQILSSVNSGRPSDIPSLVTVRLSEDSREFTLVDIGTILGLTHLIPEGDQCWLVNSRINWRTFNEIY